MDVLVTGADGYIGSVLTALLLERGHAVTGIDCGYYQNGWLYHDGKDRPKLLIRDIRTLTVQDVAGHDAVVHLAELSNDPLGEQDPRITFAINHAGSVRLAALCKKARIPRFVYTSSCSVYGAAGGDAPRTEDSPPAPQTAYAKCKVLVERDVGKMADADFTPVFLRNATAFGASPRMRFDIVLNNLAGHAWTRREIRMTSDGTPWRPLVHVQDICEAIRLALEAPAEAVAGEIFNVGDDRLNYRVQEIADIVAAIFPGCTIRYGDSAGDNRSYRVAFGKIRRHLPEFECRWTAERGARQLLEIFSRIGFDAEFFNAPPYTRLRELRHLLATRQIDGDFRWLPYSAV